nr:hypothetical protein [Candidatus Sigynarchaeota archaeon]
MKQHGRACNSKFLVSTVLGALMISSSGIACILVSKGVFCDGICYTINESVEFGHGGYPRMAQVNDLLLVAYSNGSFVLDGINMTSGQQLGPRVIIPPGIDPARATLHHAGNLGLLLCVYNHDQAAAVGIAWVSDDQVSNASAWTRQDGIVRISHPKEFFHVGVWEPYLAPYNDTDFLLYVSNQTVFDPLHPIDVNNYSFSLEGFNVVQKIDIFMVHWNGTGVDVSFLGTASHDMPGGAVHFKDGMASSVMVWENETCKEYVMTFESFIPMDDRFKIVTSMVKLRVSPSSVHTVWRKDLMDQEGGAPFITRVGDTCVTSRRGWLAGTGRIVFQGVKIDETATSKPIFVKPGAYGWPFVFTDCLDHLWLAAENMTTGKVVLYWI